MNKILNISLFLSLVAIITLASCKKEVLDKNKSIFDVSHEPKTAFDKWLDTNYVQAYNIDYKYKMDDKDIDYSFNLAPALLENAMKLAVVVKHAWLEAYQEVAGVDFVRKHAPAILPIIGSAAWNGDGTFTLGTAEGGLKITLYMANWLDPNDIDKMNEYFFHTMHHEFTHILQQDVYYPAAEFDKISTADYRPSGWQNRQSPEFEKLGFVTAYAGSNAVEDITEVTAVYITSSDEAWKQIFENAGDEGRAKLNQKVAIMKRYMKNVWHIDMDELRTVVHRRMEEVKNLQLLQESWLPLIHQEVKPSAESRAASFSLLKSELTRSLPVLNESLKEHTHTCQIENANLLNIIKK